ncbi:MAG TPA: hypothetical protein VFD91_15455 [Mariniphaga sp.]|nr:hypothetical protein [Mariniphaga sp.]
MMRNIRDVFYSFSVDNQQKAEKFYSELSGIEVIRDSMGLTLRKGDKTVAFIYQKDNHQPATFTILNFVVDNLNEAISHLGKSGLKPERYEGLTGSDGIHQGNPASGDPTIAWFKDPAGNIFSVIQNK